MSELCGYYTPQEVLDGEVLVQTFVLCSKPVVMTYVDPLDGFRYPLCNRHSGKAAEKAAERLGYVAEPASVRAD